MIYWGSFLETGYHRALPILLSQQTLLLCSNNWVDVENGMMAMVVWYIYIWKSGWYDQLTMQLRSPTLNGSEFILLDLFLSNWLLRRLNTSLSLNITFSKNSWGIPPIIFYFYFIMVFTISNLLFLLHTFMWLLVLWCFIHNAMHHMKAGTLSSLD